MGNMKAPRAMPLLTYFLTYLHTYQIVNLLTFFTNSMLTGIPDVG